MRLIPAIDLRGGRCVRLRQGDFESELAFDIDPHELLARYASWGARWIHLVDLDAARDGSRTNESLIDSLIDARLAQLQIGGGLRSRARIDRLLEQGAARAVVGSLAVTDTRLTREILAAAGGERIVLAFDVRIAADETPRVATHGWRQQSTLSLWDAVEEFAASPLRHVLCTDVARDGMLSGPNVELYSTAKQRCPAIEWQASGGIRGIDDLRSLAEAGAAAAVSGRALLEMKLDPKEIRPFLPSA